MSLSTPLTERFNLACPIIQAPMAGGGDTPDLVAAVCEAGGMGFIGGAYLTPDQITSASQAIRGRTNRAFGINLFAPLPPPDATQDMTAAIERVAPYHTDLDLPPPEAPGLAPDTFEQQLAMALESGAKAFSFTFGIPPRDAIDAIRSRGMFLMGTATTVEEAVALERAGFDAVVAQGSEAGGHRGSFAGAFETSMVGTVALVPQIADAVQLPVIASGGIMDGRGLAAALALGAAAVQMGTAFLTCAEAGVPEAYKAAILGAAEHQTRLTRAFSGRPARGIVNRFMTEVEADSGDPGILPFPLQNTLTRPMRTAAAKAGRAEYLSLWAGQGLRLARRRPAADLVTQVAADAEATLARLAGR